MRIFFVLTARIVLLYACLYPLSLSAKTLRFVTIEVAPWAFHTNQNNQPEGTFVDIVQEISRRIDHEISITLAPFSRVERELESGRHDCTILVPIDRDFIIQGQQVSFHAMGVIPHKSITLSRYEDLQNLTISVLRGVSTTPQFDTDSSLNKEYDTDYIISLRKINHKRVDSVFGAISTILHLAKQEGLIDSLGTPLELSEVPLLFQCSRNSVDEETISNINKIIDEMKEDGTLEKINQKNYL